MRYAFLLLLSFSFVAARIQASNEIPYNLSIQDQQKLKQVILDKFYNDCFSTQEFNDVEPNNILTSQSTATDSVKAVLNIYSHRLAVQVQTVKYLYENDVDYVQEIITFTTVFTMKEFCDITGRQVSNAGLFCR
ncbi:MAG: hypothetical protein NTZ68_03255 [Candidatus Dependentiae bacterium]|nr:hypothetical protein [Candidatus Dependentiae bacterium]